MKKYRIHSNIITILIINYACLVGLVIIFLKENFWEIMIPFAICVFIIVITINIQRDDIKWYIRKLYNKAVIDGKMKQQTANCKDMDVDNVKELMMRCTNGGTSTNSNKFR